MEFVPCIIRISSEDTQLSIYIGQPLYSYLVESHAHSALELNRFPVPLASFLVPLVIMQRHVLCKATRNVRALRSVASTAAVSRRTISMSRPAASQLNSLHTFTDEEEMLREAGMLFLALCVSSASPRMILV